MEDIGNVVDYARRMKFIKGRFGLFGHSRGGAMAILYAATPDAEVKSLVTWAAIGRTTWWTPEEALIWRKRGYAEVTNSRTGQVMRMGTELLDDVEVHGSTKLNVAAAAAKIKVPWLIVHGTGDETVPSTDAERLHELSLGVSTLRLIEGANHAFEAKHPLSEVPPVLKQVVQETVKFFVRNM
jgi:pimeloyl-ACP methyl ester carboxylesterase